MSTKKLLLITAVAILFNVIVGAWVASLIGIPQWMGASAAVLLAIILGAKKVNGKLNVGVFTEIWTGELVKALRAGLEATWLDGIPDNSTIVENDVIHLVDVGVDPDVLINNTTYPIPTQALDDADIAISLDKFQTKVTPITDDELHASSYDKMGRVKESHANAINDAKFAKSAHALSPIKNAAKAPVLKTTGDYESGATGRRRLTKADIIALKDAFDKLKIPVVGRRLVLCTDHVNDLLLSDQKFAEQYYNYATGKISNMYGFEVYEYVNNPLYTTAGVKKDVGATAAAGEYQASFAFYSGRVFKATGSTKMYYRDAATDPEKQQNTINFRHYFIAMPKKADACGAIYSDYKAA